jgi:hypothetical protein
MLKIRIFYIIFTVLLFTAEVLIALFACDNFVRPFLGDVFVTMLICAFIRCFMPKKHIWLPAAVFVFACFIEFLQLINILKLLGLAHISVLNVLVGNSFSFIDILCYAAGSVFMFILQGQIENLLKLFKSRRR